MEKIVIMKHSPLIMLLLLIAQQTSATNNQEEYRLNLSPSSAFIKYHEEISEKVMLNYNENTTENKLNELYEITLESTTTESNFCFIFRLWNFFVNYFKPSKKEN